MYKKIIVWIPVVGAIYIVSNPIEVFNQALPEDLVLLNGMYQGLSIICLSLFFI